MTVIMKYNLLLFILFYFFLLSCDQNKKKGEIIVTTPIENQASLRLIGKGITTIFLDETVNFQRLGKLKLTRLDTQEYLSYFYHRTSTLYLHDMESGKLMNKIKLKREGPNEVTFSIRVNYFIHRLDSIFIDASTSLYYLINDEAKVIKRIGNPSGMSFDHLSVFFGSASYFVNNRIYGSFRMPFRGTPKETVYARVSLKFQDELEVTKSVKNELFIDDFEEIMAYRKETEKSQKTLDNMPRHFARNERYLYATTPLSDSIRVFEKGELVDSFYAGISGFAMASYKEYVNFRQSRHEPGIITQTHKTKRNAYYPSTLIDPDGTFIYRVLLQGTRPEGINSYSGKETPQITGATLLVVNLKTKERSTFDLPVEEIVLKISHNDEVFVSKKGIHFRVKGQENEDQVQFRVFGIG